MHIDKVEHCISRLSERESQMQTMVWTVYLSGWFVAWVLGILYYTQRSNYLYENSRYGAPAVGMLLGFWACFSWVAVLTMIVISPRQFDAWTERRSQAWNEKDERLRRYRAGE